MSVLSICIPTRNRANYLDELLGYIASFRDLSYEVVISDNASNDDTAAVAMRWRPELKDLYYIHQETSLSGTENAYAVCHAARGDYVFRMSDDDRVIEEGLLAAKSIMDQDSSVSAIYPRWHICDSNLEVLSDVVHYGLEDLAPLYGQTDMANFKPHDPIRFSRKDALEMYQKFWTVELPIFRRSVYQRFMGGMSRQLPLDFHAAAMFLQHGDICFIADLAALVRKHEGQESAKLHTPGIMDSYASDYELFLSRFPELDPIESMKIFHMKMMSQYLVASRFAREQNDYTRASEIVRKALAFRIEGVEEYAVTFQKEYELNLVSEFITEIVGVATGVRRLILEDSGFAMRLEPFLQESLPDVILELMHMDGIIELGTSEDDFVIANEHETIEKRLAKSGANPARHRSLGDIRACCRLV